AVDEVMRRPRALVGRGLAGSDVEAAIDLHAVGADDLAAPGLGELDGELGLPARGGPDHDEQLAVARAVDALGLRRSPPRTMEHQRRPTRCSSSAQLMRITTGLPCGQWPAKSTSSSASRSAFASSAGTGSPARREPWQAIVASARSTAPENAR